MPRGHPERLPHAGVHRDAGAGEDGLEWTRGRADGLGVPQLRGVRRESAAQAAASATQQHAIPHGLSLAIAGGGRQPQQLDPQVDPRVIDGRPEPQRLVGRRDGPQKVAGEAGRATEGGGGVGGQREVVMRDLA
jgi:hypothetical protein